MKLLLNCIGNGEDASGTIIRPKLHGASSSLPKGNLPYVRRTAFHFIVFLNRGPISSIHSQSHSDFSGRAGVETEFVDAVERSLKYASVKKDENKFSLY